MTDAESIVIHGAERVDFVINADADIGNYWIRAETLEGFSADGVICFLFLQSKIWPKKMFSCGQISDNEQNEDLVSFILIYFVV